MAAGKECSLRDLRWRTGVRMMQSLAQQPLSEPVVIPTENKPVAKLSKRAPARRAPGTARYYGSAGEPLVKRPRLIDCVPTSAPPPGVLWVPPVLKVPLDSAGEPDPTPAMHDDEIPPVFVPSKNRCERAKGTVALLAAAGIPFTVVVEPQEAPSYRRWIAKCAPTQGTVAVLPDNERGVAYARNFIIDQLAPRTGWFWIMDDDIFGFTIRSEPKKSVSIPTRDMFRYIAPSAAVDPKVVCLGMEYDTFCHSSTITWSFNSYTTVCVLFNADLVHKYRLSYRWRVREDYDFNLQAITSGLGIQRCRVVGMRVPTMGSCKGGMQDFYKTQQSHIRHLNAQFVERWFPFCEEVVKGTGNEMRDDVVVKWKTIPAGYTSYLEKKKLAAREVVNVDLDDDDDEQA